MRPSATSSPPSSTTATAIFQPLANAWSCAAAISPCDCARLSGIVAKYERWSSGGQRRDLVRGHSGTLAQGGVASGNERVVCKDRLVLTWAELETAAPDITARGRELLERFQFVFVGTLTKNGSPRVNPCEAYVIDGHLLLNMMPRSLKALDLLRDPRIYVHTPVTSKEASEGGEFKLAGSASVLEDAGLRRKLDDLFWEMIQWRPAPDSHYFEVLAERLAYHKYGGDEVALRWRATR